MAEPTEEKPYEKTVGNPPPLPPEAEARFHAALDLIRRTGAIFFELRVSDDKEPFLWLALAAWERDGEKRHDCAGSLEPVHATLRLCEQVIDGGKCMHCGNMSGFDADELGGALPARFVVDGERSSICWYQYDSEQEKYRRGCDGG